MPMDPNVGKVISVSLTHDDLEGLDLIAEVLGVNRSKCVAYLIEEIWSRDLPEEAEEALKQMRRGLGPAYQALYKRVKARKG